MGQGVDGVPPAGVGVVVACAEVQQAEVHARDVLILLAGVAVAVASLRVGHDILFDRPHPCADLGAVAQEGVCHRACHIPDSIPCYHGQVKDIVGDLQALAAVSCQVARFVLVKGEGSCIYAAGLIHHHQTVFGVIQVALALAARILLP